MRSKLSFIAAPIFCCTVLYAQSANQQLHYPDLCEPVTQSMLNNLSKEKLLVYNSFRTSYAIIRKDIEYHICITKDKIDYITTRDPEFETEGLKIGMKYSSIPRELILKEFYVAGFSYEVKLKNGWEVHFLDDKILNESKIYSEAPITNFVKQGYCQ